VFNNLIVRVAGRHIRVRIGELFGLLRHKAIKGAEEPASEIG
jgi:hypothetical protein